LRVRLPEFLDDEDDKVLNPYAPAAFTPRKYAWYSCLLELGE